MSRNAELIKKVFGDVEVRFLPNGWFCATDAAKAFSYELGNWLKYSENKALVLEIARFNSNSVDSTELEFEQALSSVVKASRGRYGSTWMHPDLAVPFAMAVNASFGYWVTKQIQHILLNERDQVDWEGKRRLTKDANIEKNYFVAQLPGYRSDTARSFHVKHAVELNTVFAGTYVTSIDRDTLDARQLAILNDLERFQSVLLDLERYVRGLDSVERRHAMMERCNDCREKLGLEELNYSEVIRKMEAAKFKKLNKHLF